MKLGSVAWEALSPPCPPPDFDSGLLGPDQSVLSPDHIYDSEDTSPLPLLDSQTLSINGTRAS